MTATFDALMQEKPFQLVTYGRGGRFSPYDIDKTSALLEMDEMDRMGHQSPGGAAAPPPEKL